MAPSLEQASHETSPAEVIPQETAAVEDTAEEAEVPTKGHVRIVYVSGSLPFGCRPRVGITYWIVRAWSTQMVPTIGAQLRRRYGDRTSPRCGWVRRRDFDEIMHHLRNGRRVRGVVTETEPFWWMNVQCFWGEMDWEVYKEPEPELVEGFAAEAAEGQGGAPSK